MPNKDDEKRAWEEFAKDNPDINNFFNRCCIQADKLKELLNNSGSVNEKEIEDEGK